MSVSVAGMPNYLMYGGPSYLAAHGSLLPVNELIANYICMMIYKWQLEPNLKWFEPDLQAQKEFNEHRDAQLATTVWSDSCGSCFKAGKSDRKIIPLHPGSQTLFMTLLKNPRMQDYHFKYKGNQFAFCGNGFTTRETEERDLAWHLDPKDDHHRPRLQV
ncbi:hypothetical protein B0H13DRAFT_2055995 [Mycena leptocephala]|nr:hypothetical protein B0H13DRAFT_2055995 [Mycena leptocephala]